MPRLVGYRATFNMDVFDAIRLRHKGTQQVLSSERGSLNLFGPLSIGEDAFTNVHVPNQQTGDQTAMILNVRARTNLSTPPMALDREEYRRLWQEDRRGDKLRPTPLEEAFWSWALCTIVTLHIGCRPQAQWPLSELLRRRPEQPFGWHSDDVGMDPGISREAMVDALARELHVAAAMVQTDAGSFDALPIDAQDSWKRAARASIRFTEAPRAHILPVRQTFSVSVTSLRESTLALLDQLAKPRVDVVEPAVWVHLEGFTKRDVC